VERSGAAGRGGEGEAGTGNGDPRSVDLDTYVSTGAFETAPRSDV